MQIAAELRAGHVLDSAVPDSFFLDRALSQQQYIRQVLDAAGFRDIGHAIDYGCNVGTWSWELATRAAQVTAIDRRPETLALARTIAQSNGLTNIAFALPEDHIDQADAVLLLDVPPIMGSGRNLHAVLARMRQVMVAGGRLLCDAPSPWRTVGWLLTLERFRKGHDDLRRTAATARTLARCLISPAIRDVELSYTSPRPALIIELAQWYGFTLVHGPNWFNRIAATRALGFSRALKTHSVLPQFNWFLFARGAS